MYIVIKIFWLYKNNTTYFMIEWSLVSKILCIYISHPEKAELSRINPRVVIGRIAKTECTETNETRMWWELFNSDDYLLSQCFTLMMQKPLIHRAEICTYRRKLEFNVAHIVRKHYYMQIVENRNRGCR